MLLELRNKGERRERGRRKVEGEGVRKGERENPGERRGRGKAVRLGWGPGGMLYKESQVVLCIPSTTVSSYSFIQNKKHKAVKDGS